MIDRTAPLHDFLLHTATRLHRITAALLCFVILFLATAALADETVFLQLPSVFSNNGILQRDKEVPVWGDSDPGAAICVQFGEQKPVNAIAGIDGHWRVSLPAMQASGQGQMLTISATPAKDNAKIKPATIKLNNILVGDIWLCSGQSNMEWGLKGCTEWWNDANAANDPGLRLYFEHLHPSVRKGVPSTGTWNVCTPGFMWNDKPMSFSAVAFIFGRELYKKTGIPIGIIESALGNTAIAPWCSPEIVHAYCADWMKEDPDQQLLHKLQPEWEKRYPRFKETLGWADSEFYDANWSTARFPDEFKNIPALKEFRGVLWTRKSFELPQDWQGKPLLLRLGQIDNFSTVWINGQFVGSHETRNVEQLHVIPASMIRPGKNTIAIRIDGNHGFLHNHVNIIVKERFTVRPLEQPFRKPVDLNGEWKYKTTSTTSELGNGRILPTRFASSSCYYGNILPLTPFAIKGFTWYQGEGNAGDSKNYDKILQALIEDWRKQFHAADAPFYIVQLANFRDQVTEPGGASGWPTIRKMQDEVANRVPHSGLVVTIDRGSQFTIHPLDKQDVGKRLALLALAKDYGQKIEYSGPVFLRADRDGNRLRLSFTHADGGLFSHGGGPTGLAIAGADGKKVWANARIEGETLLVFSDLIDTPVLVEYGWEQNPTCNLYNKDNLPMVPFQVNLANQ